LINYFAEIIQSAIRNKAFRKEKLKALCGADISVHGMLTDK